MRQGWGTASKLEAETITDAANRRDDRWERPTKSYFRWGPGKFER